jgi:hypothetical protein
MTLEEAAKRAREIADTSIDPFDHARANAPEGALHAERHPPPPPGDFLPVHLPRRRRLTRVRREFAPLGVHQPLIVDDERLGA